METKLDIFSNASNREELSHVGNQFDALLTDFNLSKFQNPVKNRIRTIYTIVSDADFEASDFMVAQIPVGNVVDRLGGVKRSFFKCIGETDFLHDGWLVHRPVNHAAPPPVWLNDMDRRIVELRETAADEELPYENHSAAAARAFCEHHGRSIRPSIFLVGNGNVRLVWENDQDEQIGLQFRADRAKVQCILFKRRDDGIATITATETNSGLIELLIGNRLLHLLGK